MEVGLQREDTGKNLAGLALANFKNDSLYNISYIV